MFFLITLPSPPPSTSTSYPIPFRPRRMNVTQNDTHQTTAHDTVEVQMRTPPSPAWQTPTATRNVLLEDMTGEAVEVSHSDKDTLIDAPPISPEATSVQGLVTPETPWLRHHEHRLNALEKRVQCDPTSLNDDEHLEYLQLKARHDAFIEEGVAALQRAKPDPDVPPPSKPWLRYTLGALFAVAATVLCIVLILRIDSGADMAVHVVTVSTPTMEVLGMEYKGGHRFLGIPYAKPPVGRLRWAAPEALDEKVRVEAQQFKVGCFDPSGSGSEDCLYLNVFTPDGVGVGDAVNESDLLPVMYWVQGGCFTWGDGSGIGARSPDYHGDVLASKGRVVVVTAEYRIGAFGFLASDLLRERSPLNNTGTYGVLDQVMVLQWIQQNIMHFGGDHSKVTLFGQSSGAGTISVLMVAPQSQGLFHRAVLQSGAFGNWVSQSREAGEKTYNYLARAVNCSGDSREVVDCMLQMDAKTLALSSSIPLHEIACRDGCSWAPVIDNVVLHDYPWRRLREGSIPHANVVPTLLTTTYDDGFDFVNDTASLPKAPTHEDFVHWVNATYEYPGHNPLEDVAALYLPEDAPSKVGVVGVTPTGAELYPRSVLSGRSVRSFAASAVETDVAYSCTAKRTAQDLVRLSGAGVQHYVGVVKAQHAYADLVLHSADIKYVFGDERHMRGADKELSALMIAYWTNFARSGDPNMEGLPLWPAVTVLQDSAVVLSSYPEVKVEVEVGRHGKQCQYWESHWDYLGTCLPQPGRHIRPCNTTSGAPCIFPFGIANHTWAGCAEHDLSTWCPTSVDGAGRPLVCKLTHSGDPYKHEGCRKTFVDLHNIVYQCMEGFDILYAQKIIVDLIKESAF